LKTRGSARIQDEPFPRESSEQYSGGGHRLSAISCWPGIVLGELDELDELDELTAIRL
jgi:hypothetical protein